MIMKKLILEGSELSMYIELMHTLEKKAKELEDIKVELRETVMHDVNDKTHIDTKMIEDILDKYKC